MPLFQTHETQPRESVFDLLRGLKEDLTLLVRQEIALAKREIAGKAKGLGRSAALFAVAAAIAVYAVFFLCFALNNLIRAGFDALGLSSGVSGWLAPLAMTALLAGAGVTAALLGLKSIKRANPASPRSWKSWQNAQRLKEIRPGRHAFGGGG